MEILKASDLRIGNLVTDISGFICEIREIRSGTVKVKYHSDKDIYCLKSFSELFSIPLTEEWLMKFGFIPDGIMPNHFNIQGMVIWKCNDLLMCDKNGTVLKHVHQLQNLYYALIGEDLQCSLEV